MSTRTVKICISQTLSGNYHISQYFGKTLTTLLTKEKIKLEESDSESCDLSIKCFASEDDETIIIANFNTTEHSEPIIHQNIKKNDHAVIFSKIMEDYIGDRFTLKWAGESYGEIIKGHYWKENPSSSITEMYFWLYAEFPNNFDNILKIMQLESCEDSFAIKTIKKIQENTEKHYRQRVEEFILCTNVPYNRMRYMNPYYDYIY